MRSEVGGEQLEQDERPSVIENALLHTERALQTLRRMRQRATMLQLSLQHSRQDLEAHLADVEREAAQVETLEIALALSRSHVANENARDASGVQLADLVELMPAQPYFP